MYGYTIQIPVVLWILCITRMLERCYKCYKVERSAHRWLLPCVGKIFYFYFLNIMQSHGEHRHLVALQQWSTENGDTDRKNKSRAQHAIAVLGCSHNLPATECAAKHLWNSCKFCQSFKWLEKNFLQQPHLKEVIAWGLKQRYVHFAIFINGKKGNAYAF